VKKDTSFEIFDYRKQAEFKRKILNDNPMEQKVLDATFCLSTVIGFLSLVKTIQQDDYLSIMAGGAMFLMLLHGWKKTKQDLNYTVDSIKEEIDRSKKVISTSNENEKVTRRLNFLNTIESNPDKPFEITYYLNKYDKNFSLSWEIGDDHLLNCAHKLEKLFSFLQNSPEIKRYGGFKSPKVPDALIYWKQLLPHLSHIYDMPSKFRLLSVPGIPAKIVSNHFGPMLCGSLSICLDSPAIALMFVLSYSLSNMAHSYILNKEKTRLNLNGFTNIYQSPVQWPPTCIGQQLSEELVLYPNNIHFQQVVDYLLLGHLVIEELKKSSLFEMLLPKTKRRINSFPIMFKEEPTPEYGFMSPA